MRQYDSNAERQAAYRRRVRERKDTERRRAEEIVAQAERLAAALREARGWLNLKSDRALPETLRDADTPEALRLFTLWLERQPAPLAGVELTRDRLSSGSLKT